MPTASITPDLDAIVTEIDVAAPPERVFRALTDAGELKRWFRSPECPTKFWEFDARAGGKYSYATEQGTLAVNGVREFECHGEVLEYAPQRLLVYTCVANWHHDTTYRTVVRWDLTPTSSGTRVKVTHSGLTQEPTARRDYSGGWPGVLQQIKKLLEQ